jgi:hypothetical protein
VSGLERHDSLPMPHAPQSPRWTAVHQNGHRPRLRTMCLVVFAAENVLNRRYNQVGLDSWSLASDRQPLVFGRDCEQKEKIRITKHVLMSANEEPQATFSPLLTAALATALTKEIPFYAGDGDEHYWVPKMMKILTRYCLTYP